MNWKCNKFDLAWCDTLGRWRQEDQSSKACLHQLHSELEAGVGCMRPRLIEQKKDSLHQK